jgi:hypothetical protein
MRIANYAKWSNIKLDDIYFCATTDNIMRTPNVKTRLLLDRAIELSQLPVRIPRGVAADFIPCDKRTLLRAEKRALLRPYRRGQLVTYDRTEFLRYCGIQP